MSFTINENAIGIKGASGQAWITTKVNGSVRDVVCHMKIPGHWIFKTESKMDNDPLMSLLGDFEVMPVGKNGSFDLMHFFPSPRTISYWDWHKEEIGWYGWSTDMSAIIDEFKEMGKYISSVEARSIFDDLYEKGDPRRRVSELEEPNVSPVGAGAGLSDEERREKNRKAKERAKARKMAAKTAHVPVGMAYKV